MRIWAGHGTAGLVKNTMCYQYPTGDEDISEFALPYRDMRCFNCAATTHLPDKCPHTDMNRNPNPNLTNCKLVPAPRA
jgi:hypothetical protein